MADASVSLESVEEPRLDSEPWEGLGHVNQAGMNFPIAAVMIGWLSWLRWERGDLLLSVGAAASTIMWRLEVFHLIIWAAAIDACILFWHKANPDSQRLAPALGAGPMTATAIVAAAGD